MGKNNRKEDNYSTSSSSSVSLNAPLLPNYYGSRIHNKNQQHNNKYNNTAEQQRKSFQVMAVPIEGTHDVRVLARNEFTGTHLLLRKFYGFQVTRAAAAAAKKDKKKKNATTSTTTTTGNGNPNKQQPGTFSIHDMPQVQEMIKESNKWLAARQNPSKKGGGWRHFISFPTVRSVLSFWSPGRKSAHDQKMTKRGNANTKIGPEMFLDQLLQIVQGLKDKRGEEDPTLTYTSVLHAVFGFFLPSISSSDSPSSTTTGIMTTDSLFHLFLDLINKIVTQSAKFFQDMEHQEEAKLLSPRHQYRALTSFWVYNLIEWIVVAGRQNNGEVDDLNTTKGHHHDSSIPGDCDGDSINDTTTSATTTKNLCPRAYAFSFLYPYTDDIMDDETIDKCSKRLFVSNINKMLEKPTTEEEVYIIPREEFAFLDYPALIPKEQRTYDLINVCVAKGNRSTKEMASDFLLHSLRNVNAMQVASMRQKRPHCKNLRECSLSLTEEEKEDIFDITNRKGASSTIPAAYLLCPGGITEEEADFCALLGVVGQNLNDIEGTFDDWEEKLLTPALISFFKHNNTMDRFLDRCLSLFRSLSNEAPKRFPSLPLDRVLVLFMFVQSRFLSTTALLHEKSDCGVLTKGAIKGLEYWLKTDLKNVAVLARAEQELFGGVLPGEVSQYHVHQLSSPEQFRSFMVYMIEEARNIATEGESQTNDSPPTNGNGKIVEKTAGIKCGM